MTTVAEKWTKPEWAVKVDAILKDHERSRSWLSRKIRWSQSCLSRSMSGHPWYKPNAERRRLIAEALDVPESVIFSDGGGA